MPKNSSRQIKIPTAVEHSPIRPTLKTISEISGFAVQTVSRALSDAPDISAKTKETVRKIADDIGYVPNRAGVRLRTGKTNVISLILSTHHDVLSLTSRLISSIAEGLRDTPYHLVVTHSFADDDPMKTVRYIVENGTADAIIMNQIQPEDPRVKYLIEKGFPFATHGRTIWSDAHSYFDYDNFEFGKVGIATLAGKGRKHVLLLMPPMDQNYAIEIYSGAKEAAAQAGMTLTVAEGVDSDSHRNAIRTYVAQKLRSAPDIDCLMSASPNGTMAAIAGLEDAGLQIGERFDVFSKETVPILELFRPGILSVGEDVTKAGAFLAKAAVDAAENKEGEPMQAMDRPQGKTY
jgi:LacI family transcriptional regulator